MKYSTQELYDIDPKVLAKMPYQEALEYKLQAAQRKIQTLVHLRPIHLWEWSDEDVRKHKELKKAVKWCQDKLEELK